MTFTADNNRQLCRCAEILLYRRGDSDSPIKTAKCRFLRTNMQCGFIKVILGRQLLCQADNFVQFLDQWSRMFLTQKSYTDGVFVKICPISSVCV